MPRRAMARLMLVLRTLLGLERRKAPRPDAVKAQLEQRHLEVARKLSKLNGHSADEILADAYRDGYFK